MVGPPFTMLLIVERLLIVQQEIEANILMPTDLIETLISNKNKMEPSMELTKGEPSKRKETPQIFLVMAEPIIISNVNINFGTPLQIKLNSSKEA